MISEPKKAYSEAMRVLKQTSRTFYIPIALLKPTLKKTVASAYLCMRAVDEIEDHEELSPDTKTTLLHNISQLLHNTFEPDAYHQLIQPYVDKLPEVTIRLSEWLTVCPKGIIGKVKEATGIMASGMAKWVEKDWQISTKEELDEYTYYVAGLVGIMLSDIWKWYDNIETDPELAIAFGRGLQAVNILRNQEEDQERGVNFIPNGWNRSDLFQYASKNLNLAEQYIKTINNRNITMFCRIPHKLAEKTLAVMKDGHEKMTREEVRTIVDQVTE